MNFSENGTGATRIASDEELVEAFRQVLANCRREFGEIGLQLQVFTWDRHYGDVLADGVVVAAPYGRNEDRLQKRIRKHREEKGLV